jgi:hypothetical protein
MRRKMLASFSAFQYTYSTVAAKRELEMHGGGLVAI